jgi:transposase-like protein
MQLEVESNAGAARNERSEARTARLNRARRCQLDTTAGSVQLAIPQEAYINGANTRKVEMFVEEFGIETGKSKPPGFARNR